MKTDVHCTNCQFFLLPPGEANIKLGKCKRFVRDHIEDIQVTPSPAYLVSGIHDTSVYHDAIVCRTLGHMCGMYGYFHVPLDGFGTV